MGLPPPLRISETWAVLQSQLKGGKSDQKTKVRRPEPRTGP